MSIPNTLTSKFQIFQKVELIDIRSRRLNFEKFWLLAILLRRHTNLQ